jgi:hypothetical protein
MTESINTEGVVSVGEINTRLLREAKQAADYHNAEVAGAVRVLNEAAEFLNAQLSAAGPYDDTRTMRMLLVWIGDKIREVQTST